MLTTTDTHRTDQTLAELSTLVHDGHSFTSGGAYLTPDRIVVYVGKRDTKTGPGHLFAGPVTLWEGTPIGRYLITGRMHGFHRTPLATYRIVLRGPDVPADLQGATYYGKGHSPHGMCLRARRSRKDSRS